MKKRALITGITGQDGSYLAELLLNKGYEVFGFVRRVSFEDEANRLRRIHHLLDKVELVAGSLESFPSIYKAVNSAKPDEIYHLAAQSYVSYSFDDEFSTFNTNINGTHHILAACRDLAPNCKVYYAGTSEMFGSPDNYPQNETTPYWPRSAYGISKLAGFHLTKNYRENYRLFACSGILYNHESPRRGFEFVTRKISSHAAKIKLGLVDKIELGNLDAKRDWGHAKEYVEAIWLMLQQDNPRDFVIGTGKLHSVRDFCRLAFEHVGLNYKEYVFVDPKFYRKESHLLVADGTLAMSRLGWSPTITFDDLVREMVDHDLRLFGKNRSCNI